MIFFVVLKSVWVFTALVEALDHHLVDQPPSYKVRLTHIHSLLTGWTFILGPRGTFLTVGMRTGVKPYRVCHEFFAVWTVKTSGYMLVFKLIGQWSLILYLLLFVHLAITAAHFLRICFSFIFSTTFTTASTTSGLAHINVSIYLAWQNWAIKGVSTITPWSADQRPISARKLRLFQSAHPWSWNGSYEEKAIPLPFWCRKKRRPLASPKYTIQSPHLPWMAGIYHWPYLLLDAPLPLWSHGLTLLRCLLSKDSQNFQANMWTHHCEFILAKTQSSQW